MGIQKAPVSFLWISRDKGKYPLRYHSYCSNKTLHCLKRTTLWRPMNVWRCNGRLPFLLTQMKLHPSANCSGMTFFRNHGAVFHLATALWSRFSEYSFPSKHLKYLIVFMLHHKNTSCQLFIFLKNFFIHNRFIFIIAFSAYNILYMHEIRADLYLHPNKTL